MGRSETFNIEIANCYVRVAGEVDMHTAPRIEDAVMKLVDPVQLDLGDVTFMDSTGLHMLLKLRRVRPELRVVAVSPRVERVLDLTGMRFLISNRPRDDSSSRSVT
jgi:anti-anti-sigma factor